MHLVFYIKMSYYIHGDEESKYNSSTHQYTLC